jgi:hypothetical protein
MDKLNRLIKDRRPEAKLKRISPNAPRVNGEAENAMRQIKDILSAYVNNYQDNWDEHLLEIQAIMNSMVSDATGYTPNFMVFGRELPNIDESALDEIGPKDRRKFGKEKSEVLKYIWDEVATKLTTVNVDKFNKSVSKKLEFIPYKEGDFIYIKRIPRKFFKHKNESIKYVLSRKYQHRYCGPFIILKKNNDVSYTVDMYGKSRGIHVTNMKKA